MTRALEKAFDEAARLPEQEQEALAAVILAELESERRWERAFSASHDQLSVLAAEALAEHATGATQEFDPEEL